MLETTVRERLTSARKNKNSLEINVFGLLLGEIQTASTRKALSQDDELQIVKKLIKSNETTISAFMEGGRQTEAEHLKQENALLLDFLPKGLSVEEIKKFMEMEGIVFDGNVGKTIGMVMKKAKEKGVSVDAAKIKECLQ